MTGIFEPVDPTTVSAGYLQLRTALLLAAYDRGLVPDPPVPSGWFRCFTCRREIRKGQSDRDAAAEHRFGEAVDDAEELLFVICDDCNRVVSEDTGVPL